MPEYSVEAIHLTKRFGDFVAVDDVSLRVRPGEIFGFLGPNGSGKTTTIRMLCGLLTPDGGQGLVLGYDIARQAECVKPHIGYMSQRFSLYEDLTVWENLSFFAGVYAVPSMSRQARLEELVTMAGLEGRERELVANLSTGWRQRLALGCAIVHQPPILFLDEPTAGVDPVSRRQFWEMIYALSAQGVTVFVTTHYMDEAEHCHTVSLMHKARLIACDSPDQLKSTALSGEMIEIEADPLARAMDILAKQPGVRDLALYGNTIHAVVDLATEAAPRLSRVLTQAGIPVARLEPIEPALEDAFVSLIGRQRKGGGDTLTIDAHGSA